jgi:hypothetical protein
MTINFRQPTVTSGTAEIPFEFKGKSSGLVPKGLMLLSVIIILAILGIIMANVFYNGF